MTPTAHRRALHAITALCFAAVLGCSPGSLAQPTASPAVTASPTHAPVSPAATPPVTPTPGGGLPDLASTYESPAYGYTIAYPAGWTITNGNAPWPAHTILRHNDPHLDVISGRIGSRAARFVGASQPVPPGTTLVQFLEWQGQHFDGSTCPPGDYRTGEALPKPVTIDGIQALADLDGCGSFAEFGGAIWDIVVIADSRGYNFTFDGALHAQDVVLWLSTIKLDPSAALDAT